MLVLPIYIASATPTTVSVSPAVSYVAIGSSVSVDINVSDVVNLTSWQFTLYFSNGVLNCTDISEGPFLNTAGDTFFGEETTNNYNSTHGRLVANSTLLGKTGFATGSGVLATVTFDTLKVGDSAFHLSDTELGDNNIPPQPITHNDVDGTVHVQDFRLIVTIIGSGSIIVHHSPHYHYGETVQLTAIPATGWSFDHWSGDLNGSANPATLNITGNMYVNVTFTQDQYTLAVTIVGSGSVTKIPDQATYIWGTNVTLAASANLDWMFAGWTGDASSTVTSVTVNMTSNKAVTATFARAPTIITVPYDYPTIQEAINAANPGDAIMVATGTYLENIVVNKTVTLIGEDSNNTIIDGGGFGTVILVIANNVSISKFTIKNSGSTLPDNGILINQASYCNVSNNILTSNYFGIWLKDSSNNVLSNNNVTDNNYGIGLEDSSNNTIYHNKFVNTLQISNTQSINIWDNGYPSGGNYWSDYTGVDLKSGLNQDQLGSDGIGDTPYTIDANNTDRYPLMNANAFHDVAITNLTTSKTIVGQGYNLCIQIEAENKGSFLEIVSVTVYINTTSITQTINLPIGATVNLTFAWNTTGFAKGNYTLSAYIWPVLDETDTHDNSLAYSDVIKVTVPGDTNGDGNINIYDVVRLTSTYGIKRGEPDFNPNCDIDGNDKIDIYDVVIAASRYGYIGS